MACDAEEQVSEYRPRNGYGVMTEEKEGREQSLGMLKPEGT